MLTAPPDGWIPIFGLTLFGLPAVLWIYLVISVAMVGWNIATTTRVIHAPANPPSVRLTAGLGALLLVPAIIAAIAVTSVTYGRSIQNALWLWPAVTLLFATQAALTLIHRTANPVVASSITLYNVIVALVSIVHYFNALGVPLPDAAIAFSAAQANLLSSVGGESTLWHGQWILIPLLSPAAPSHSRLKRVGRVVFAAVAALVTLLFIAYLPSAYQAVSSYHQFANATVSDRPNGGLAFGIRVFPALHRKPTSTQIERDFAVHDSLAADAISVIVTADAAQPRTLDSLANALDLVRTSSTTLIVTLGYPHDALAQLQVSQSQFLDRQMATLDQIMRRLRPTIIIPVHEPYGEGARALGVRSVGFWQDYLIRASRVRTSVNPSVRIGLATATAGPADSVLYHWAARPASPVDILGFSLLPTFRGGAELDARIHSAQRWMRNLPSIKPHWIWAAGGSPAVHGEASQQLVLRISLAWATLHPFIRGIVADCAGDYDKRCGLVTPSRRPRAAFTEYRDAIRTVRETFLEVPLDQTTPEPTQAPAVITQPVGDGASTPAQ